MHNIVIKDPAECCGCGACVGVCPTECIQMCTDDEGFDYPDVDTDSCNDCGLCSETCPWKTTRALDKPISPPQVYAAWHLDQNIRRLSSSGGVFTALAEDIIVRGGAVVGAAFDEDMCVRHVIVEDTNDLERLRGSKYVQSEIPSNIFSQIHIYLKQGRYILFSGTPCQVAGIRNYLGREYKTLFCCDLICHGVPSPGWLKIYLDLLNKGKVKITRFSFREKEIGWKRFGIKKKWADGSSAFDSMSNEPFLASFLKNYCLRASCYSCKFTTIGRQSDITLADFWGVATKYPEYDQDDRGTSLLLVNTKRGQAWLSRCEQNLFVGVADLAHASAGNPHLTKPASRPIERDTFLSDILTLKLEDLISKYQLYPPPNPLWRRASGFIIRYIKKRKILR